MASAFRPVAPLRVPLPPSGDDYLHELKWDGFRGVAIVSAGEAAIFSKSQQPFKRFSGLSGDIQRAVRGHRVVLDGEVVCLDEDGRPDFAALMAKRCAPVYAAFDLLALNDEDLRALTAGGAEATPREVATRVPHRALCLTRAWQRTRLLCRCLQTRPRGYRQ